MNRPTSQVSLVLYKLLIHKKPITVADFKGFPRISEYVRILRRKYNLDIETIPIKFTTQFGTASEYASYKLKTEREAAIEVYKKIIDPQ